MGVGLIKINCLWEETHVPKGSNPSTASEVSHFSHLFAEKIVLFFEKTENELKRDHELPIFSKIELEHSLLMARLFVFQFHRKSVKRGFEFTLMVVGESGLGKSTVVNSLFLSGI